MNIALLMELMRSQGEAIHPEALRPRHPALERDLDELEAFGYQLERHPYHGVRYVGPARRLCPDQIEYELGTRRIGRRVAVWRRVTSTNDLAARAASSRHNDGLAVLAEEQTAGRGRLGRQWVAPSGTSLLCSVLLFPPPIMTQPAWLTALGAVAVAEVSSVQTGRAARVKWPNDVRLEGRKLAGVLVERSGAAAVIGIGLNVDLPSRAMPEPLRETATSLAAHAQGPLDRSALARELLRRLDAHYDDVIANGPDALEAAWQARLEWVGQPVVLTTAEGEVSGRLSAASLERGLRLDRSDGTSEWYAATEIQAVRPGCTTPAIAGL